MRKFIATLILILLFGTSAHAAVSYNGSSGYVAVTYNSAAMDIPNGDFTIVGWAQFATRAGTGVDYIFSFTDAGGTELMYFRVRDASNASSPNVGQWIMVDTNGHDCTFNDTGTPWASNTSPVHVALRRSGDTFSIWYNGTQNNTNTDATCNAITPSSALFNFGREAAAGASYFNGNMWEWAKWDRALTDGEILELSKGFSANCLPNSQKWFYPMGGPYGYYKEYLVPITVTNSSTTTSDAQRMIYCN